MIDLERHIEILLLNNDCVIIPNFGGFMVHHVEARYDEKDQIFLPPYRTLGFNPQLTMNDYLLAQSYIEAYDISYPEAIKRIEAEVEELNQILENEGVYELNDIGTLSKTENGSFNFVPCEAGILTPALYGLASFEFNPLNAHKQKDNFSTLNIEITNNSIASNYPTEKEKEQEKQNKNQIIVSVNTLRNIAAVIIGFIVFMLIPSPTNNAQSVFIKSNIDTGLLYKLFPKDIISTEIPLSIAKKTAITQKKDKTLEKKDTNKIEETIKNNEKEQFFCVVLASRIALKNAEIYVKSLHNKGYTEAKIAQEGKFIKVIYGAYQTEKEAQKMMNELNNKPEFEGCWITKLEKLL